MQYFDIAFCPTERIPSLRNVIGNYAGKQFTPADPVVVAGVAEANFIISSRPVDIMIDLNDLDSARGFRVMVVDNAASQICLSPSFSNHPWCPPNGYK